MYHIRPIEPKERQLLLVTLHPQFDGGIARATYVVVEEAYRDIPVPDESMIIDWGSEAACRASCEDNGWSYTIDGLTGRITVSVPELTGTELTGAMRFEAIQIHAATLDHSSVWRVRDSLAEMLGHNDYDNHARLYLSEEAAKTIAAIMNREWETSRTAKPNL